MHPCLEVAFDDKRTEFNSTKLPSNKSRIINSFCKLQSAAYVRNMRYAKSSKTVWFWFTSNVEAILR